MPSQHIVNPYMGNVWNTHCTYNIVVCLGDINRHADHNIDEFHSICGWHHIGQTSLEGKMQLKVCLEKISCVKYMV